MEWQLVPKEPTREMRAALRANGVLMFDVFWRDVLSAAPEPTQQMTWRPIETAPRDALVLLHRPTAAGWGKVAPGRFEPDAYATKPKPYWRIWLCIGGATESRRWTPTEWMPLTALPKVPT